MTQIDLTATDAKAAREALRAYADNLDVQLTNVKQSREGELDLISRRDAARDLFNRIPAPKTRKPRKPASSK